MDNLCVGALIDHRQGKAKRSKKNLFKCHFVH